MSMSLKAARINAGLTQEEVHKKTGFATSTIVSWESNRTFPKTQQFIQLCNLYGGTMSDIFVPETLSKN